jgi:hypothetical protein
MRPALPPVSLAAALLVSGCAGGDHPAHSSASTFTSAAAPPAKTVTYPLGSSQTVRGVTVAPTGVVVRPGMPPELVLGVANWAKRPHVDLEFDPYRVVVRQAGRRISAKEGPSFVLTTGGASPDFIVELPGFRPNLPYTVTASVVAATDLKRVPRGWHRPLRSHWRFTPALFSAASTA